MMRHRMLNKMNNSTLKNTNTPTSPTPTFSYKLDTWCADYYYMPFNT